MRDDLQGEFHFTTVKLGAYTARYSAPGYWSASDVPRQLQVPDGGDPVKLIAPIMPLGRNSGRVIDSKGKAVPNATIELSDPRSLDAFSRTEANGKFDLHGLLFPGMYTLNVLERTILDKTGLSGKFDVKMEWTDVAQGGSVEPAVPADSSGPSIFNAIQEQLGLKLES